MKLHKLTPEQAAFIWNRGGHVSRMVFCVRRELPMPFTGEDLVERRDGLATKAVINQFSRREDYPG